MKTMIFFFWLITGELMAQPAILKTSFEQMEAIAKEVPSVTVKKYEITRNELLGKNHVLVYTSDKYELRLSFSRVMEGVNKDLEIEGTPVYKFHSASGPFLDLLKVWQKYFDASADQDKVLKDDYAMITVPDDSGGTDNILFKRGSTDWMIVIRH